jgi:hypothetical protein
MRAGPAFTRRAYAAGSRRSFAAELAQRASKRGTRGFARAPHSRTSQMGPN